MADWTSSMERTYEYYLVDPSTWGDTKQLRSITKSSISRDTDVETLGSASIDTTEMIGEGYVRTYLTTIQNGVTERHPLGTHLVQTPGTSFDGMVTTMSLDAYTPLLELKEKKPPVGYYIPKGTNVLERAYQIVKENARAPVVRPTIVDSGKFKLSYDFVADVDDSWLEYISDALKDVEYQFDLDEMGRILFVPKQKVTSLQPVWTYTDDNSSILYPQITVSRDLYGIPNVVEVIYSKGDRMLHSRKTNTDKNSPTSIPNRGREIVERITDPELPGENPTQEQIDRYTEQLLEELSSVEYTVTYSHGYCPVRVNDCVRLNYTRAGINNVKAKVIKQTINCTPECEVSETAIFTTKLWKG